MAKQWVYRYDEVQRAEKAAGDWDGVRALLGGKGANLADMTRLELPVPPGFVITTEACNAYLEQGEKFPQGLWEQVEKALAEIEKQAGKKFDPANPRCVLLSPGPNSPCRA
jgi:pyruvate,orthophosphate dikinase